MLSPLKKALALAALPFSLQAQAYEIESSEMGSIASSMIATAPCS